MDKQTTLRLLTNILCHCINKFEDNRTLLETAEKNVKDFKKEDAERGLQHKEKEVEDLRIAFAYCCEGLRNAYNALVLFCNNNPDIESIDNDKEFACRVAKDALKLLDPSKAELKQE